MAENYAFVWNVDAMNFQLLDNCSFIAVDNRVFRSSITMMLKKDSPYLQLFNYQ